jgi:hypothetical protein
MALFGYAFSSITGRETRELEKIMSNGSRRSRFYGLSLCIAAGFCTASGESRNGAKIMILTSAAALQHASLQSISKQAPYMFSAFFATSWK